MFPSTWMNSRNPIVRRHLGLYWRTLTPELRPLLWIGVLWALAFSSLVIVPEFQDFLLILLIVSLLVMPFVLAGYASVLYSIATHSAETSHSEFHNNTLPLLVVTPMSLIQVFLGKIAAALWRRMDDLYLVAYAMLAVSPPALFAIYNEVWHGAEGQMPTLVLVTLLALAVSAVRLVLEALMVGAIGVACGALLPSRPSAIIVSVLLNAGIFGVMWLVRQSAWVRGMTLPDRSVIPPNGTAMLIFDLGLSWFIPLLVMGIALGLAAWRARQD